MRSLATAPEALALDARISGDWRVPGLILMENAAVRMWSALSRLAAEAGIFPGEGPGPATRIKPLVVALAGPGNNGGDALAVLRQARFAGHERLAAILVTNALGEAARLQRASLDAMGIPVIVYGEAEARARSLLDEAALIVDGIAGTGLKGALRKDSSGLVLAARASGTPVAAVDMPSGLRDDSSDGDLVLPATWTLSVEPRKLSLYHPASRALAGRIEAIDGVFPAESYSNLPAVLLEDGDLPALAPRIGEDAHKGTRGRLAVFAGSAGMAGAACLVARGAFAASAGLVNLHVDPGLYHNLSAGAPGVGTAIVRPLPESRGQGRFALEDLRADAFAIGPGWGRSEGRAALLKALLEDGRPAVVDADGLHLLAPMIGQGFRATAPLILTPHPGEFEALTGLSSREVLARPAGALRDLAAATGAVVVLKSHVSWIAAPDGRIAVCDGREPSLAVAGSGDVLAGLCAGLLSGAAASARCGSDSGPALDAFACAEAAVLAHALAGREARKRHGWYEAEALATVAARVLDPPQAFL